MRFVADGPQISDLLLNARDEGRVVFFCGAGVSRAAGLPDFFGLAESVLQDLGAEENHDAKKVLDEARRGSRRSTQDYRAAQYLRADFSRSNLRIARTRFYC